MHTSAKFTWLLAACCAGPALAQPAAGVQVYGLIDTNIDHRSHDSLTRMGNSGLSGSRLGFRGQEALGQGLQLIFALEHGLNTDDGTAADPSRFFNRMSFVGLETGSQRVTVGRQYTSIFDSLARIVPLKYALTYEPFTVLLGNVRNDNSIKYRANIGAGSAQVHYAFGESAESKSASAAYGAALNLRHEKLSGAVFFDQQNGAWQSGAYAKNQKYGLGAAYDFTARLSATAGVRFGKNQDRLGVTSQKDKFYWAGISYQLTQPLKLAAAYYRNDFKLRAGAPTSVTAEQLSLQAVYGLSKRTDLYAAISKSNHASINFAQIDVRGQRAYALGVRHAF